MSDLLDQLLAESNAPEDDPREEARKLFEEALERAKAVAKCIPDDKEDLAEEKVGWTTDWDGSLKRLWNALDAARKLGVEATIDKRVLLEFKHVKATSTRWKEEAQLNTAPNHVLNRSFATAPDAPPKVGSTSSASTSALDSHHEVSLMTRPDKVHFESQGGSSTQPARDDAQEATLDSKSDDLGAIRHDPPCERCASAAVPCRGILGRACERCRSISQRCSKSTGRGGIRIKRKRETDVDGDQDAQPAPEASKTQRVRAVQRRRVMSPANDPKHDGDDVVEIIDSPSATSKGKQKAQPSKPLKSSKPSINAASLSTTTQPKPVIVIPPLAEKPQPATVAPKEILKTLGELESLALVASAEAKHAQAETKKAEGTLDILLSEIRSFRNKHGL